MLGARECGPPEGDCPPSIRPHSIWPLTSSCHGSCSPTGPSGLQGQAVPRPAWKSSDLLLLCLGEATAQPPLRRCPLHQNRLKFIMSVGIPFTTLEEIGCLSVGMELQLISLSEKRPLQITLLVRRFVRNNSLLAGRL